MKPPSWKRAGPDGEVEIKFPTGRRFKIEKQYGDASWVSSRLAELLPIRLEQKQYFLQLDDPLQRLERLSALMDEMEIS